MNDASNIANSGGLLKKNYAGKGPIAQMNDNLPMMTALRSKLNSIKQG